MLIAFTSDIHIDNSKENSLILEYLLESLLKEPPDVFIIAGDVSQHLTIINKALSILKDIKVEKLFIPGNHDIWKEDINNNSYLKYFSLLPRVVAENNFYPLWLKPVIFQDTGFCGSMGWYDYSLANKDKTLFSEQDYQQKQMQKTTWMDKHYVRFLVDDKLLSDKEITDLLYNRFVEQCESIYDKCQKIIAVFHHLPFREMVHYKSNPQWDYFNAFMGAEKFGQYLKSKPKIKLVIAGHSHYKTKLVIPHTHAQSSLIALSSPYGYFATEGFRPVEKWYQDRLTYLQV